MYVGKKLKNLRLSQELSQEEMAEQIGVSQSYYSSIERSKKPISKKLTDKIIETFKISKSYFENDYSTKTRYEQNEMGGFDRGSDGGINSVLEQNNSNIAVDAFDRVSYLVGEQMINSIRKENPQLFKTIDHILDIPAFSYALDEVLNKIVYPVYWGVNPFNKAIHGDYQTFKKQTLSDLETLQPYDKAFENLSIAIARFYKEMKESGSDIDFEIYQ